MRSSLLMGVGVLIAGLALAEEEPAVKAARQYLKAILSSDAPKVEAMLGQEITLLAGHEFLKPKFGLADDPGRKKTVTVSKAKYVTVLRPMLKRLKERRANPENKLNTLLAKMKFELLKQAPAPMKLKLMKGDRLVKVEERPGEAFILLQLRPAKQSWRVVAEYLD